MSRLASQIARPPDKSNTAPVENEHSPLASYATIAAISFGIAFLAGDGSDVNDPSVVVVQHPAYNRTVAVEETVDVDVEDLAPGFGRLVPGCRSRSSDASAAHQDVNLTKVRSGRLACPFNRRLVGNA
jgi:hypothetical protein